MVALRMQLSDLEAAIDNCPAELQAAQDARKQAEIDLKKQQRQAECALMYALTASCPMPSDELNKIFKYLLWTEAMKSEDVQAVLEDVLSCQREEMQRREGMKEFVWLEFWTRKLRISLVEFPQYIPEFNNHYENSPPSLAHNLHSRGELQCISQDDQVFYEADDPVRFFSIYRKACAALAAYDKTLPDSVIDSYMQLDKAAKTDDSRKSRFHDICESVRSLTRPHKKPTIHDIFKTEFKKYNIKYDDSRFRRRQQELTDLVRAGILIRIWDEGLVTKSEYKQICGYSDLDHDCHRFYCYVHWEDAYKHPGSYLKSERK